MVWCDYCDNEILENQKLDKCGDHEKYWNEWNEQYNLSRCVKCGEKIRPETDKVERGTCVRCATCGRGYKGYEEPGR